LYDKKDTKAMTRSNIFQVRLSEKEREMVKALAEADGLSEADYIRTQIILLFKESGLKLK
jgi:predicted DNA binding CopG/RHH family protein